MVLLMIKSINCFCLSSLFLFYFCHSIGTAQVQENNLINAYGIEVDNMLKNLRVHVENRASLKN